MQYYKNIILLLKRIPNVTSLLLLVLVSGLTEGIGLSILVPMTSSLTGEIDSQDLPMPFGLIPEVFVFFGVEPSFGIMLLLVVIVMLLSFLLVHIQERAVFRARYKFMNKLRNDAGDGIFSSRWEYLSDLSSGDVANQIIHESDRGSETLIALMIILATFVQIVVYSFFAFLLSWEMFLIALFTLIFSAITATRLIRAVRRLGQKSTDINTLYSRQMVDYIRGSKLLKATGTTGLVESKLHSSNAVASETLRKIVTSQSLMKFELQAIISISMVVILYFAVSVLDIQVSILLVFLFIIMRLAPKLSTLQGQYHNFSAFQPALDAVDKLIRDCELMKECDNPTALNFTGINNAITLTNVHYKYPNSKIDAVSDLSLELKKGQFIALVGSSGSGKSTVLDLIMGLIEPSKGKVFIDGKNLKDISKQTYRNKIGFVSQENIFFTGSIRDNLCLNDTCEEQQIWHSLSIAQIDKFVRDLPNGLDENIGEAGVKLSGGQRQRLAIARALVRSPSLLVLDEATSALDGESEAHFQRALESIAHNYTLIVVAHRLATVRKSNNIYVMKNGSILQSGSYSNLAKSEGIFSELIQSQASI
jgi:ATP-binding cassette, subfamily C, bacterial